jgi:hypothetical protein
VVEPHLQVLLDGEPREHVVGLRDEADAQLDQLVRLLAGDVLPAQGDGARAHPDQPEQRLEQGRLAGAVRADDADQLALAAVQVAAVEDVDARHVAGEHVVDAHQRALRGRQVGRARLGVVLLPGALAAALALLNGVLMTSPRAAAWAARSSASPASSWACSSSTDSGASWWAPR